MFPPPPPSPRLTHEQLAQSFQAAREALARLRATLAQTVRAPPQRNK